MKSTNGRVSLPGSARAVRPGAKVLGVADPDEWIELTIKVRRKQALPDVGGAVNVGGGTNGGGMSEAKVSGQVKRISRSELELQYGADPADMEKVKTVLTGLGFQILKEDPICCSIRVGGTADVIESAFLLKLFHYSHASGNYRGRRGEVHMPAELDGIVTGVFGLDTRSLVKRRPIRKRTTSLDLAERAAASRSWFYPAELAAIYDFPDGNGKGQTVGVVEFGGGYFESDLVTFCKNANISMPTVRTVSINNTPTNQRDGAEGEVMLDVEVIAGVCPAADIVVYFSSFDESGWVNVIDAAVHDQDNPVSVLSISWGYAEDAQGAWTSAALDAINDTLKAAALLGVTVCVAAGDDGSDDQVGDGHAHVDFPSSSPYVLGVGGTTLRKSTMGAVTEVAWKDGDGLRQDNGGSTGGGVSTYFARPDWQTVTIESVNPGAIDGRVVPDVAADASANTGYWVVVDGRGGASGGTSASAPLWAALIARINASLGTPVGYLNPLLYGAGANGQPLGASVCRDIVSGNNSTASIGGYTAGKGYDAVTGWGVPIGTALLEGLKK
ncbi:MAG: S8/S53 family peptidase [Bacteroidetes bacterium]|nr:S8/S53 family peptidase [Bacteroidota bacterium]